MKGWGFGWLDSRRGIFLLKTRNKIKIANNIYLFRTSFPEGRGLMFHRCVDEEITKQEDAGLAKPKTLS